MEEEQKVEEEMKKLGKNKDFRKKLAGMDFGNAVKELASIKLEVRQVYENQTQIIPALVTIYEALKVIAEKERVELPPPKIDMNLEE